MEGLSIGRQLQWLTHHDSHGDATAQRARDQERCYQLLASLEAGAGGKQLVSEASAYRWPRRGVYIFFENGETRGSSQGKSAHPRHSPTYP